MLPSVKRKGKCLSGKATPRYLSWEGQGPRRPHAGSGSMEGCTDTRPPQGNSGKLDVSLVWTLGREGEQARPGSGCGQCCEWNQGLEPGLHTAPTSLGCTSYPLPAPVVDLGPDWNFKLPLSRPFSVPSVCLLKHRLQYVLQGLPSLFQATCIAPTRLPQGLGNGIEKARMCLVASPAPIWPHLPLFTGSRSQMAPGPDLSPEHSLPKAPGLSP